MADPLSTSASIVGDAPTEVGNLIRKVRSLSVILYNLSLVAFGLEEIEPPEPTAAVHEPLPVLKQHYLHDCHQLLRRLETGLSRTEASLDSGSGRQGLEMIQNIQRYNQIIHTALAADSLAKLKHCLSRQIEMKDGLEKINRTVEKILDIQVKIALDAKRNQILHRICVCFTRVYLIVDAIDECDNRVEANVKSSAELALSQGDDVINMALFSRDESIIRTRLEKDFSHVEIEAHTEDLQLYVAWELSERIASKRLRLRDQTLKDLIMTRLAGEAKGMFRWVACQLDYMCELSTDRARREALSKLPPSLYATYDRILLRIDGYNNAIKRLVKRALLMLTTSFSALHFEGICEAISLEGGATTLEDDKIVEEGELLRWCSSLVQVNKSSSFADGKTRIQFAHFTVQEYLQSLKTRNSDHQYPQLRDYAVSRVDLLNVSVSPLTSPLPSETIISLTLSCPDLFVNNVQVITKLLRAGVSITAQDVQLFRILYDRCLQMPAFTSETSQMWSLFPQLLKVLDENNTPGDPRFVLHQETTDYILRTSEIRRPQSPDRQSLNGASNEEVLKYFHSLIRLNDGAGMSAFLATPRAELAKSTVIDPEHPGWNALHLALLERSYRVLDPLLAFGLDPCSESPQGSKPVHMCCQDNTCEALQILLRFGGSILDTDNLGRTVWHLAAEMNSVMVLEGLLDLGDVDVALKITSKHHETPICAAATRLHLEAVSLLLPFCNTEEHWTNSKALSVILYEPRFSGVIQSLHGFGILSQTSCGMHALACAFYRAILLDDVQTCEKLYGLGCPLECELPFPVLLTPLALSTFQSFYKVMAWLFKKGAPVTTIMAHATKDTDCTPLFVAVEQGATEVVELLIDRRAHVDVNGQHSSQGRPIKQTKKRGRKKSPQPHDFMDLPTRHQTQYWALQAAPISWRLSIPCWGSITAIQNLIKLGISDLEHHYHEHGSPLNAAIQNYRWEAVKYLMFHGAKVPEDLGKPKNSTLSTANPDFIIREWLFVGRHTERKRISLGLLDDEPDIKSWSGVWVVGVLLQRRDRKCSVESILEYAKRRHWIEVEYKSSAIRDTQLVRPKERCGSISSIERQGYCWEM
ncbi:Vegetative incompatibility HET-E-1 [Fusarium acutatum]|uniref:Vegetative incompatibility HET-E-1 n=1 Tax=Fusarium acutatum TaxID=78861 RepID=A0A8H4NQ65_9HYPO|nr:Vegetative incompatibility HET-E-1 [Fusarium acutatum]